MKNKYEILCERWARRFNARKGSQIVGIHDTGTLGPTVEVFANTERCEWDTSVSCEDWKTLFLNRGDYTPHPPKG